MASMNASQKTNDPIPQKQEDETFLLAMQLVSASVLPMVLKTAIELDLLELMAKIGPMSASELSAQLASNKNPDAPVVLDRILRLLATHSVLNCTLRTLPGDRVERVYSLAPVCKYLSNATGGGSVAQLLLINHDKVLMESWYHLKDAILEGGTPFNKAYGMSAFEYHGKDQRFNKVFNLAMSNHSTIIMNKILQDYKGFEGLGSIVDVGGGTGAILNMIVTKYPTVKGINFDLPHVIKDAPSYKGVEHIGGDMFASVPKGDAIFMKWICHDWSDEHCKKILKNCHEALPTNGKMIVAECIIPEPPEATLESKTVIHADVIMLALNPGGKERTEEEFKALATGAGFKHFRKSSCAFNTWIMEFYK